jgi:predicted ATPase/DNA-binding SARP family transcriptional activator
MTREQTLLKVQFLGVFQVSVLGVPIAANAWCREASRSLFTHLVLNVGTKLTRDRVKALINASSDNRKLSNALFATKRALGAAAFLIRSDQNHLWLERSGDISIDVDSFETLVDVVSAMTTDDDDERLIIFKRVSDLYRGPLLPDSLDPLIVSDRVALQARYQQALRDHSGLLSKRGKLQDACAVARIRFQLDPIDRDSAVDLVRRLITLDRLPEVLEVYQQHRTCLASALGDAPNPELQALIDTIREPESQRSYPILGDKQRVALDASPEAALKVTQEDFSRTTPSDPANEALFGRRSDVEWATSMLQKTNVRLVTLYGIGGVGKTTLARAVMKNRIALQHATASDHLFIDARSIGKTESLLSAAAQALEIDLAADAIEAGTYPTYRCAYSLLVIDNFEFVFSQRNSLTLILASVPSLKLIVTSRLPLGLSDEWAYSVSPLEIPDVDTNLNDTHNTARGQETGRSLTSYPSVELFCARARLANERFELTSTNSAALVNILTKIDGIPLAIELTAARCRYMDVTDVAASLDQDYAQSAHVNPSEREREGDKSAWSSLYWAYAALSPSAQMLLRYASVYVDGFTPALLAKAMSERCANVYVLLDELFDAALLLNAKQSEGPQPVLENRCRVLEPVRRLSYSILSQNEHELRDAQIVHARAFATYLSNTAKLIGANAALVVSNYAADESNIEEALLVLEKRSAVEFTNAMTDLVKINSIAFSRPKFVGFFYRAYRLAQQQPSSAEKQIFAAAGIIIGHISVSPGNFSVGVDKSTLISAATAISTLFQTLPPHLQADNLVLCCLYRSYQLRHLVDRCDVALGLEVQRLFRTLPEVAFTQEFAQRIWTVAELVFHDTSLTVPIPPYALPVTKATPWFNIFRLGRLAADDMVANRPPHDTLIRMIEATNAFTLASRRIACLSNAIDLALEACDHSLFNQIIDSQMRMLEELPPHTDRNRLLLHLRLLIACRPSLFDGSKVVRLAEVTEQEWRYAFGAFREQALCWLRFGFVTATSTLRMSMLQNFLTQSLPGFAVFDAPRVVDALAIAAQQAGARALAEQFSTLGFHGRQMFNIALTPLDRELHRTHTLEALSARQPPGPKTALTKSSFYGAGFFAVCAPLVEELISACSEPTLKTEASTSLRCEPSALEPAGDRVSQRLSQNTFP